MKKINYPKSKIHEREYVSIFNASIINMQRNWDNLRATHHELVGFESDLKKILLASYSKLVDIYIQYTSIPFTTRTALNDKLNVIFDYEDKWCGSIAEFFIKHAKDFHISSCFYCDTAYINTYEVNPMENIRYFLRNAPLKKIASKLVVSEKTSQKIIDEWNYKDEKDFNRVAKKYGCRKDDKFNSVFGNELKQKQKRHFDLDHALPKSECPLVALSLYNFVPSCPTCNQRLKKTFVLGRKGIPNINLSPTSETFEVCDNMKFFILPRKLPDRLDASEHPENYHLIIDTHNNDDVDYYVKLFKLRERYDFHKIIALHWMDMKKRYNATNISMMASLVKSVGITAQQIKSDIFQEGLDRDESRCFSKLKSDILKMNK